MRFIKYCFLLILIIGSFNVLPAWAQLYNTKPLPDRTATTGQTDPMKFNRYEFNKYVKEKDPLQTEPTPEDSIKQKISVTPEELRKLGASEDLIRDLMLLNAFSDSLTTQEEEKKRLAFEKSTPPKKIDSLSVKDLQTLIQIQKRDLITKALALPEPKVHGHDFFRRSTLKMMLTDDPRLEMRPPDDYMLSVGDELNITMWGNIDYNRIFTVDKQGGISPDLVGRVYLRGLTLQQARELLKEKYAKTYDLKKSKIEISVSYQRVVTANFVGELLNPGTYRFPALTTAFNALVTIDGPNQFGSVRNIYIKRNGQTIKNLDVYEYLSNPNSKQDFYLEDNDYIVIPSMGPVVTLAGRVRRPFNYELKQGEGLIRAIDFAGGLEADAFAKTITIKRYQNYHAQLIDINLDSLKLFNADFPLLHGDSIMIHRLPLEPRNFVEVIGAVSVPGKYEYTEGNKISDVMNKVEGVLEHADLGRAYVIRLNKDMSKRLIPFNLEEILKNPESKQNIVLQNLDTLQVLSRKDFRQDFMVKIFGAVRMPGEYSYADGLTLNDLFYLSGGMKKEAANTRIEVSRLISFTDRETGKTGKERIVIKRAAVDNDLSVNSEDQDFELKPYDHVFVRYAPDFEAQQIIKIYGEVVYPGEYALTSKEERILSVIERAGGLTPYAFKGAGRLYRMEDSTGYVLLDIERAIVKPEKSKFNYILTMGDSIYIPKMKNVVTLSGAISHFDVDSIKQVSAPYEKNKRAKFYINKYGGGFNR